VPSSLLERTELTATGRNSPSVEGEVTTLDNLITDLALKGELGLKMTSQIKNSTAQRAAAFRGRLHAKGFEFFNFLEQATSAPAARA
jgi:hypothetical protein